MVLYRNGYRIPAVKHFGDPAPGAHSLHQSLGLKRLAKPLACLLLAKGVTTPYTEAFRTSAIGPGATVRPKAATGQLQPFEIFIVMVQLYVTP
jgi:hypothetical protein